METRVRFAPSPTGFLHVGSLRTALYNFLFAKKNKGLFILRIEDTDQTRLVPGAVENLISTLKWANINYDEGPEKEGKYGPYVQSQRLEIYKKYANQLIQQGHAYYCFCTPERLELVRQKQIQAKLPPAYDRHCRKIDLKVAEQRINQNEPYVIRMKVPFEGELTFNDLIRGTITINFKNIDDQVLLKSDGFPTYHLAVVVDDNLMKISHVIRGEEWLSSTPKHILLFQYLGWQPPFYAHLPLLLNMDRSKLSKRQGDVAVEDYRRKGYLKEALVNFISLLGWNPGGTQEIFTLNQLIEHFSLEAVNKAAAIFDLKKLDWINGVYMRQKTADELIDLILEDVDDEFLKKFSTLNKQQIFELIDLYKDRAKNLKQLVDEIISLDQVPKLYDEAGLREFISSNTVNYLEKLIFELEKLEIWTEENISNVVKNFNKEMKIKLPEITQPLRLALTGITSSPSVFSLLKVFDKNESLKRINVFLQYLKGMK